MTKPTQSRPIEILLVEDNPGDVDLAREAFENGKVHNSLHVVIDGEAAIMFLRRQGTFAAAPVLTWSFWI